MQTSEDWKFWQWALGIFGSMLSGAAIGGWIGRGMLDSITRRVENLEREQGRCQATLKNDIQAIVQQALDRQSLKHTDQLSSIRTELAVITALHGETQQDVKALFIMVDRRKSEMILSPTGERRDQV